MTGRPPGRVPKRAPTNPVCKAQGHDWGHLDLFCRRCGQSQSATAIGFLPTPEEMLDNLLSIRDKLKPIESKENE